MRPKDTGGSKKYPTSHVVPQRKRTYPTSHVIPHPKRVKRTYPTSHVIRPRTVQPSRKRVQQQQATRRGRRDPALKWVRKGTRVPLLNSPALGSSLFDRKFRHPIVMKVKARENRAAFRELFVPKQKVPKYLRPAKVVKHPTSHVVRQKQAPVRVIPRMLDPLSKSAKRSFKRSEVRLTNKEKRDTRYHAGVIASQRGGVKKINHSVQWLRDHGVVSGKSRSGLARALQREKWRQEAVAAAKAEAKRPVVKRNARSGTSFRSGVNRKMVAANYSRRGGSGLDRFIGGAVGAAGNVGKGALGFVFGQNRSGEIGRVQNTVTPKRSGFGGQALDLLTRPGGSTAAALVAAEQLTRVSSAESEALSSAIRAAKSKKSQASILKAWLSGVARGFTKNKSGFAKPLQDVGVSRGTASAVGFAADILLDPTTYLALGGGAASKIALRAAGRRAAEAAVRAKLPRAIARERVITAVRAAEREAAKKSRRVATLKSATESSAIKEQRATLDRLVKSGRGDSTKAKNIRRNIEVAGRKNVKRIKQAEVKGTAASKRAKKLRPKVGTRGPIMERAAVPKSSLLRKTIRGSKREAKTRASTWARNQKLRRGIESMPGSTYYAGWRKAKIIPVLTKKSKGEYSTLEKAFGVNRTFRMRPAEVKVTVRRGMLRDALRKGQKVTDINKPLRGSEFRRAISDLAPNVRSDARMLQTSFEAGKGANRIYRAGRQKAASEAHRTHTALLKHFVGISDEHSQLWIDLFERMPRAKNGRVTRPLPKRDGSYVYVKTDNAGKVGAAEPIVIPREFSDKYIRNGQLIKGDSVYQSLVRAREGVVRSGQAVGDVTNLRVPNPKVTEVELGAAREARDAAKFARQDAEKALKKLEGKDSKVPLASRRGQVAAARTAVKDAKGVQAVAERELRAARAAHKAEVAASKKVIPLEEGQTRAATFYPHRRVTEDLADTVDSARGAGRAGGTAGDAGELKRRKIPTPISEVNTQGITNFSTNPVNDVAAKVVSFGRIAAENRAITDLASRGSQVKFKGVTIVQRDAAGKVESRVRKGYENIESFYARTGITPDGLAGPKLYRLGASGLKDARYDLRLVEGQELKQFIAGKDAAGKVVSRDGQFVALDPAAVKQYNVNRTGELTDQNAFGLAFDRVSNGMRRLAIATPRYHVINELGDTWIMFSIVPGLKVPFYKTKAIPVLRYLQAQEAGKVGKATGGALRAFDAHAEDLGKVELFVGDRLVTVKELADDLVGSGGARQGQFAHIADLGGVNNQIGLGAAKNSGLKARFTASAVGGATRAGGRLLRSREDWSRVATYMYLRDTGVGADAATHKMLAALIDYGDLSNFERKVMRRAMFFYTFPARQIPYQTKMLLKRPGKLAAYEKLRFAAANAQGIDLDTLKNEPWYVQANVPIPIRMDGEVVWLSANLPFNMINQSLPFGANAPVTSLIKNDFYFGITSLNPIIRTPVELSTGYNFFFRKPIESPYGANQTDAPAYLIEASKNSPWLRDQLGLVHKYVTKDGVKSSSPRWVMDTKVAYELSQLMYGPLRPLSEIGKLQNTRGLNSKQRNIQFFLGPRFEPSKAKEEARSKLYTKKKDLEKYVNKHKDETFKSDAERARYQRKVVELRLLSQKLSPSKSKSGFPSGGFSSGFGNKSGF